MAKVVVKVTVDKLNIAFGINYLATTERVPFCAFENQLMVLKSHDKSHFDRFFGLLYYMLCTGL